MPDVITFGLRLLFLTVMLSQSAQAGTLYGSDIKTRYPAAIKAYRALLPPKFKILPWVRDLNGVSGPVQTIDTPTGPALLIWVCKPHDCSDNQISVLVTPDGKHVSAKLRSSELTGGQEHYFGAPSPSEQALLDEAGQ